MPRTISNAAALGLLAAALGLTLDAQAATGDQTSIAPAAPVKSAPADNRLILSGDGSTLTGTSGGEGGSINFLHGGSHVIIGAGGEYQKLATAKWAFGSLTGALSGGGPAVKWTIDAEAHRGAGDIDLSAGKHHYDYGVEAIGVSGTFADALTIELESRQFDIDTTHGNLPRIGVGMLWRRRWLTTVSYARSISGNLGTELVTLRVDHYGRTVNWLAGAATGHVAPPVVNIQTGATGPAPQYHEGYLGITRRFPRIELAALADYLDLAGSHRITLTLTLTYHFGGAGT